MATSYNSRDESEWPPHPARLHSALVATHFAFDPAEPAIRIEERSVLEWLERQGAPSIAASEADAREVVTVFVPVNDVALTDVDEEARRLDEAAGALRHAEAAGDSKRVRTASTHVKKAKAAFDKAVVRATQVPAKPVPPR